MLSLTVEYALAAMTHLAGHYPVFCTVPSTAAATGIPEHYTFRIVPVLERVGLVVTHRARGGGAKLARQPASITLLEIVNAVGTLDRSSPTGVTLAPLNRKLDAIVSDLQQRLARVTLADVAVRRAERL